MHSPSAEVQGHGPGQEVLQVGKEDVGIEALEPTGNYALKIRFDDGHDSGLFTWDYLYALGKRHEENWAKYLERLEGGRSRARRDGIVILGTIARLVARQAAAEVARRAALGVGRRAVREAARRAGDPEARRAAIGAVEGVASTAAGALGAAASLAGRAARRGRGRRRRTSRRASPVA